MSRDNEGHAPDDALRILIVEDNERICELFRTWLADQYHVEVAFDGDEALESFDPATDIILLDRRMPSMSGDDVLSEVRSRGWNGQVIMVTAVEPTLDVVWMDFDDYLMKPVDKQEMLDAVEKQQEIGKLESELQEYLSLVAKRQTLEESPGAAESNSGGGDEANAYDELLERISELEQSLKPKLAALDEEDILSTGIRDLWYEGETAITQ